MSEETDERRRFKTAWIIGGIFVVYAAGWLWSYAFFWQDIPGIYWLNLFWKRSTLPVGGIIFAVAVALVIIGIVQALQKKPGVSERLVFPALMLVIMAILLVTVGSFGWVWFHQDTIQVDSQTYHTAAYSTFLESHFAAFECGPAGLVCRRVYFDRRDCMPAGLGEGEVIAEFVRVEEGNLVVEWCGGAYEDAIIGNGAD
jgi:hypothetical protein